MALNLRIKFRQYRLLDEPSWKLHRRTIYINVKYVRRKYLIHVQMDKSTSMGNFRPSVVTVKNYKFSRQDPKMIAKFIGNQLKHGVFSRKPSLNIVFHKKHKKPTRQRIKKVVNNKFMRKTIRFNLELLKNLK